MSDGPQSQPTSGGRRRRSGSRTRGPRRAGGQGTDQTAGRTDGRAGGPPTGRRSGAGRDPRRDAAQRTRRAEARHAVVVPPITYPEDLPVSARRADIAAAIRDHQVVVVSGETGSGKTTQLPKILLDLGRGRDGQIGHTQPRRIAARTVAERISQEISGGSAALGSIVGYQVRFTDQSSAQTLVKVMTDGILLAQIQRDPQLLAYDTLIIDEAHERSLNIDFILGYLTRLLPRRPDLKVVITSATIDSARFAEHFTGPPTPSHPHGVPAPVIEVTGRTYPVEIRYRPLVPDPADPADPTGPPSFTTLRGERSRVLGDERDLMTAICEAVDELTGEGPGDILVFLSGEREIRDAEDALRSHLGPRAVTRGQPTVARAVELLPLYSRLSSAEQHRVFEPHGTRRVVLATNVAETSLTVPGVRYVVDPGTARISRYSKTTKVQRLPIEPISQASANQRSGRCGRVADGIAIRLYSEADFAGRPEFTEPEILRTSLASVILQMVAVGVAGTPDDVARFPFVEPPDVRAVRDGVQLLTELGALESIPRPAPTPSALSVAEQSPVRPAPDKSGGGAERTTGGPGTRLTEVGRALALLPIDPRLGRMIVEGGRRDVAREVMVIAAALSIQDPRERPAEQRAQADQSHARYADPTSDFLTYLNLWHYMRDRQRELSGSAFRRMCRAEHLNYLRLREWQDVVTQLKEMARPLGITVRPPAPPAPLTAAARSQLSATGQLSSPAKLSVAGRTRDRSATDKSLEHRRLSAAALAGGRTATDNSRGEEGDGVPETGELRLAWDGDRIHQALLSGLLSHLGMQEVTELKAAPARGKKPPTSGRRQARNEYLGARGVRFAIFPGSPLSRKPPAWIMAGELVETSRLWARDVARIQPEWAEELAGHLVKRVYSEPAWSTKQGAAVAQEKVLLYGVPIVAQRRVLYAKVDPEGARELFVRHALVQGEWTTHHAFFHDNRALLADAEQLEHRARRRGLVVDDDALFDFYDERVPAEVVSARHFDTWWKTARRTEPDLLTFTLDMLVTEQAPDLDLSRFPSRWPQGDLELPVTYQFDPGTEADGVTVHVPLPVLNRVRPEGFDWLVPGMLADLVTATIRSLPKAIRVQLVPAPDAARDVVQWIGTHQPDWADIVRAADMAPSFHDVFAQAVLALRGVQVPPDAWDDERLPSHLRVTFRVHEERAGSSVLVDQGPNLVALQRRLADQTQQAVRSAVRDAVGRAVREAGRQSGQESGRGSGRGLADGPAGPDGHGPTRAGSTGGEPSRSGSARGEPGPAPASVPAPVPTPRPVPIAAPAPGSAPAQPAAPQLLEQVGLTGWPTGLPEGRIPETVSTDVGGLTVRGYPALVVDPPTAPRTTGSRGTTGSQHTAGPRDTMRSGDTAGPVSLRVLADAAAQSARHDAGVRELLLVELGLPTGRVTSRWSAAQSLSLAASPYPTTAALVTDLQRAAVGAILTADPATAIRDAETYDRLRGVVRAGLEDRTYRVADDAAAVLTAARDLDAAVRATTSMALLATVTDLRGQLDRLVPDGFVTRAGAERLPHLVRYLRAGRHRLDRAATDPQRDQGLSWQVHELEQELDEATAAARAAAPDAARDARFTEVCWMLEELRVSLFAQQLGTAHPVSAKRIRAVLTG